MAAKDILELHKQTLQQNTKDKFEHYKALFKFISDRFMNEKEPYTLTSFLSYEMLLSTQLWRDFIIYPSAIGEAKYCNMAFHPNSVDENLVLQRVYRFEVTDLMDNIPILKFENKSQRIHLTKMIEEELSEEQREFLEKTCL